MKVRSSGWSLDQHDWVPTEGDSDTDTGREKAEGCEGRGTPGQQQTRRGEREILPEPRKEPALPAPGPREPAAAAHARLDPLTWCRTLGTSAGPTGTGAAAPTGTGRRRRPCGCAGRMGTPRVGNQTWAAWPPGPPRLAPP